MMHISSLTLEQTVYQSNGNLVSDISGEKVMMSIRNGQYYNLDQVGGRIWEIIEKPIAVERIVSQLITEYDLDREYCEEHVLRFLNLLNQEGLIETWEAIL